MAGVSGKLSLDRRYVIGQKRYCDINPGTRSNRRFTSGHGGFLVRRIQVR